MKTKLLSILFSAMMVFTLLPTAAYAEDGDPVRFNLWVGGTRVTSDAMSGEGWSYEGDATSGTLTLKDAVITGTHEYGLSSQSASIYASDIDLTIRLVGDNTLSAEGQAKVNGISTNRYLSVTGDGSLGIEVTDCGINCRHLTFDNTNVKVKGDNECIHANNAADVEINGGRVELTSSGSGITCGVLRLSNDAELTVTAGARGLSLDRAEIKDSILTLETISDSALYADEGDVTIENSEVSARTSRDVAIECYSDDCNLFIIGSKVTAESSSYAITANSITIKDGTGNIETYVEATTSSSVAPAIFAETADGIALGDGLDIKTPEGGSVGSFVSYGTTGTSVTDQNGNRATHVIIQRHVLELTEGVEPTCTEPGAREYYTCSICGKFFSDETGSNEVSEGSWILPATGHDWGEWSQTKAPTCSATGEEMRVCMTDPSHTETREVAIDPDAHEWDAGKVTKEPTEKAEGVKTFTCELCGETKTETLPKTKPAPAAKVSGTLLAKITAKGKSSLVLTWTKMEGVEGYDVFFSRCDKKAPEKVKTIKGNKASKWTKKGLDEKTAYKALVKAYVTKNGKKTYVGKSLVVHAYTSGGTKSLTNSKSVTAKKTRVSLKVGKTYKVKASVTKLQKGKKLMSSGHAPKLRYVSSDKRVATVSKSGKITAKGKGSCKVYAIAVNGARKAITVTVA